MQTVRELWNSLVLEVDESDNTKESNTHDSCVYLIQQFVCKAHKDVCLMCHRRMNLLLHEIHLYSALILLRRFRLIFGKVSAALPL